ncbi:uncharacterized protein LAESUDRAFT_746665 [Laetiporus sulphureus 93-53]|uniref:DUF6534 domain-containing protein n=1 Tax=Laetiporus sulphureus 93-53 TaxID=1314785 RepID=A0A165HKK3_9APHY|nr:uncharacterized protein LAESUDRAFT_746665 [Laetiporus sulphureus 93-53]KZT11851.1 hypothetical protein LAESUDRAFT_746665 [Laetiporus sulphureus 93-53]
MSETAAAPDVSELNATFGVLLIGFIFAVTLYGLTFFQTYIYYSRFPSDPTFSKYTIGLLWAVDTATTTLLSHTLYYYLITSFMAPFDELDITKTFVSENALAAFGIFLVQVFYAYRIYIVNGKNPALPGVISLLAVVNLVLGIASAAKISQQPFFYNFVDHVVEVLTGVQYGLSTLCDIIIVGALLYYVTPARYPGMKSIEGWYEYIAVFFINRGTCFTLLQLVSLILFVSIPSQQVWILFHFVTSKTYINSLLLMLNFRNVHHGRGIEEEQSMNQRDVKSSGVLSGSGSRNQRIDTSRSVQFGVVDTESKAAAMTIGLDTIQSGTGLEDDEASGQLYSRRSA